MTPASSASPSVKVVLVEDEPLYRDLLRIALTQKPDIEVLGAFSDGDSALAGIPALQPQVAILDIDLRSSMNGVQLGILLRRQMPDLGVVLLSNHGDPEFVASLPGEVLAGWSY